MWQPVQIQHGKIPSQGAENMRMNRLSCPWLWGFASDLHRQSSERDVKDEGFSEGFTGRKHPQLSECAVGGVSGSSATWFMCFPNGSFIKEAIP